MKVKIAIGHPSYKDGTNAQKICLSKSSAVRELQNRFVPRKIARNTVDRAFSAALFGGQNGSDSCSTELPNGLRERIEVFAWSPNY